MALKSIECNNKNNDVKVASTYETQALQMLYIDNRGGRKEEKYPNCAMTLRVHGNILGQYFFSPPIKRNRLRHKILWEPLPDTQFPRTRAYVFGLDSSSR